MEIAQSSPLIWIFISLFHSHLVFAAPAAPSMTPSASAKTGTNSKGSVAPPSPCSGKNEQTELLMDSPAYWRILGRQYVSIYHADLSKCYYKGQVVDLYEMKPPAPSIYWTQYRGKVTVYSVTQVPFGSIRRTEGIKISDQEIENLTVKLRKKTGKMDSALAEVLVLKVTVVGKRLEERLKTYGSPKNHPSATSLNAQEFAKQLAEGNVYDIRPYSIRGPNPISGAKAITITNPEELANRIHSPIEMKRKGINLEARGLPKPHQPITVVSGCSGEFSAYNALTLLYAKGYRKLSWYPGGFEAYRKFKYPCETPKKSAAAQILDGRGVATMKAGRATTTIDLRIDPKFSILGSTLIPFNQQENQLLQPKMRKGITLQKLQQKKEGLDTSLLRTIPTHSPVILVGANSYDWRPYKAAIILKSLGYKNIYWYRDGMDDWAQKALIYPKYFRLSKTIPNKDLY